jgi:glycerol-3-phosphate dehydrogenase
MDSSGRELDALLFGGGVAGLWLLDELHRRGFRVWLIERRALGAGQTVASQGILHGGLKYALGGSLTGSATSVREATDVWRRCLEGRVPPDLRGARVLSPSCYLWRTDTFVSAIGLTAARFALRTPVTAVAPDERPPWLRGCAGEVLKVEEAVIDVVSLLRVLADRHAPRLLHVADPGEVTFFASTPGGVERVELRSPGGGALSIRPRVIVFTAGEGNAELRRRVGLSEEAMQLRPLHMVVVRGNLPMSFGHCVDGHKTRVTLTSATDAVGRTAWQVGGEIAERGVTMTPGELIAFARCELPTVLPRVDFAPVEWATYRINRAEGRHPRGARPDGPVWRREGSVITAWPTKLVLAPRLAEMIADSLGDPVSSGHDALRPPDWPSPPIARPPWEVIDEWTR